MSLRINTNVTALTALRNLGSSNTDMAQSIQRLSTGLRINSAADDPAGLIISEGMRAQLKGIQQAISNSQDAVNMAKTAEGAMDEVQRLLREMRTIAVHSANSAVVDGPQLQANQNSLRSAISSIDRIAGSTQWGARKLLDGTAGVQANLTNVTDVAAASIGSTFGGMRIANGPLTIQRTTAAAQESLTTNTNFTGPSAVVQAGSFVLNGYTFTSNGSTDTVQNIIDKVNAQSPNTGVTASLVQSGSNYNVRFTNVEFGADFKVNYFDAGGMLHSTANPAPTTAGADAVVSVTASTLTPTGTTTTTTVNFTGGQGARTSGLRLTDSEGNVLQLTPTGNAASGLGSATAVGVITAGNVRFQIGQNADQSVTFAMPNTRASQLGVGAVSNQDLSTLDVTTQTGASNAILIIDKAIEQLSQMRGNLGSFQKNYLESTIRSLTVANENLTATESTIRDVDMAEEMTRYTKFQILQQSGMSVLAQANQQPQQVLQLFRGG